MAKNANAISFFSEDVREEKSGQSSMIGIFEDVLHLASFPTVIPKVSILTVISMLVEDPFQLRSFRVFFQDGETVVAQEIPDYVLDREGDALEKARSATPSKDWISMKVLVQINNLAVDKEDHLCVEFTSTDGSTIRSNTLRFLLQAHSEQTHSIAI